MRLRPALVWTALSAAMAAPVILAAFSPYLAFRNPAYIIGGFAGILALALLLIQPLLAAGYLPGLRPVSQRRGHRLVGTAIIGCVALHVGGLYATSPVDTLDALLLAAPTPFSVYGVIALWSIAVTALLVAMRARLGLGYRAWRLVHNGLALIIVAATAIHALQIEGAMEPVSKALLTLAVLAATIATLTDQRLIRPILKRPRPKPDRPR